MFFSFLFISAVKPEEVAHFADKIWLSKNIFCYNMRSNKFMIQRFVPILYDPEILKGIPSIINFYLNNLSSIFFI